jgi:streptogramin lyase/mono/diheme cytochrome c family protein
MRLHTRIFVLVGLIAAFGGVCLAGTIAGTVKGADGAAFKGAFVEAQNAKSRITTIVLSDGRGEYRIPNLSAGEYRLTIRAVGFRADPKTGVNLGTDQKASVDFALQKGLVRWNDLSFFQLKQLLPAGKGKDLIAGHCSTCHLMQTRMASMTRDQEGWRDRVEYMRTVMHFFLDKITDQQADDIASYLATVFGPDSVLPKSPADMPGYKETLRPLSGGDATNIVYVEYEMPGPNRMPFSAAPAKDGSVWIPGFGVDNMITRLDPKTGEMQDYKAPNVGAAAIHSAVPAPDGSVWLAEQGTNKIGRWDPGTKQITEFQDSFLPGMEGMGEGGNKHTVRLDPSGNVWGSGQPLTKFDPETRKFTHFDEVKIAYDVKPDKNGDVWFTEPGANKIGKVDGKTMKVSTWTVPTPKCYARRMEIGPDGMIWVGEFNAGKIARFDLATETFKEYTLPGQDASPYAMGFDADGYLWYDSHNMDVLARFDTKTGDVVEYPVPHSEIAMREFFRDEQGRMWYGTNPNNRVGYFYLTGRGGTESARK